MVKLDPRPTRADMTDRECAKLLGAVIGGLIAQSDIATVRRAVDWWSQNQSAWDAFRKLFDFATTNPDVDIATTIPFDDAPPKPAKW